MKTSNRARLARVDDALVVPHQFDRDVGDHFENRPADGVGGGDAGERPEGGVDLDEAEIAHPAFAVAQRFADVETFLHPLEQPAPARLAVAQPAFAHDLAGRFEAGAEHAADPARTRHGRGYRKR